MSITSVYIQYGVPEYWAKEYERMGLSSTTFKHTSKKNLLNNYSISIEQIQFVKNCLNRNPIEEKTTQKLLEKSNFLCCLCKGTNENGYIIHHLVEYSKTQDNSYSNLAVLCLNHHDLAHREGLSLTSKISVKQIQEAKKTWEKLVVYENKVNASRKINKSIIKDWKNSNPFKELKSYTESDKDIFFGRDQETKEIILKLNKHNVLGLFGESGTGKTSLINAGLIPILKTEDFIIVPVRCLDEPIKRIRIALLKSLKENRILNELIDGISTSDSFPHLILKLQEILENNDKNLVIIIDQFEELFTRVRKEEREQLAKGIIESLANSIIINRIYFLISLREDYIGELWDWSHENSFEDAWIRQFRIKRLNEEKAYEVIVEPLIALGITIEETFIRHLISEFKTIGDNLIYPPYLQIACSELFEEYKIQNIGSEPTIIFGFNLYKNLKNAESIISEYLSDSILYGLTAEEKTFTENILDLLTGPDGLRTFLNIDEISKHLKITPYETRHIIEHLVLKKIVHPVVESDKVIGYELVHDFLSKKFFEKLGPEEKKSKTTIEIFRQAFKEWKQHQVLASKDRLKILFENYKQLPLGEEEWTFLIKSSFSVYWYWENKWVTLLEPKILKNICIDLLDDKDERIKEQSIDALGKIQDEEIILLLKDLIESKETSDSVKEAAIRQFYLNIKDNRILDTLKQIIKNAKNFKLRKNAVYAFGTNISYLSKTASTVNLDDELQIIYDALNDPLTQVRKQAADILTYTIINEKSLAPLLKRLKTEFSISSRKAIVSALLALYRKDLSKGIIYPILKKISEDISEDYRVREEARYALS